MASIMSAFDRALKRVREESDTIPEGIAEAAAWLPPTDDEDASIPPGLLDRFATEEPAGPRARPEPESRELRGFEEEGGFEEGRSFTQEHAFQEERAFREEPALPQERTFREEPAFPQEGAFREEPVFPQEPALPEEPVFPAEPDEIPSEPVVHTSGAADSGYRRSQTDTEWKREFDEPLKQVPVEPQERRSPKGLFNGFNPKLAGMLVTGSQMDHATAEQYGRLAAVLHHAQTDRTIKTVMVTSAMAGEGKTLTALNLALTLSESYGRRVAFIDADLRCSRVHELLNVVRVTGLSEALEDDRQIQTRMLEVSPRLSVLLAGCSNLDPKGALTSARMGQILAEAAKTFDWVIVDTPPVVLLPDTDLLARMVDGAIVVVRAGRTTYDSVQRAIQTLDKKRVLGIVLNDAQGSEALQYYYSSDRTDG
jgi:capsular exopolysaccharide synthesis family protein